MQLKMRTLVSSETKEFKNLDHGREEMAKWIDSRIGWTNEGLDPGGFEFDVQYLKVEEDYILAIVNQYQYYLHDLDD